MQYGLNNNLGSANNVNKTQNSSFFNKKNTQMAKGILDIAGTLGGVKNGKTGWDRIMSIIGLIKGGKALFKE